MSANLNDSSDWVFETDEKLSQTVTFDHPFPRRVRFSSDDEG